MRNKDQILLESIYDTILLEKDHRQKMISFGIPQDVADYLHNFDDKYSLWFADKIKKMAAFQSSSNKINWINSNLMTKMQGIMDWVRNVPNINLKQYNWDQAVEAQSEYHENIQINSLEGVEKNKIIKKYSDGFYWVDLESTSDCSESSAMGHCGRTGKADTLYSLRKYFKETNTVEPFITMAISPDENTWYQCKGKRNSKPKPEYYKYIADILITQNCFIFKTEYSSSHDFTNKDLEEYVQEHSNEIPNSDEILEKISGNNVTYADFQKIYNEYNFTYYTIDLNEDEENIFVNYDFNIVLNYNEFSDIPDIKSVIEQNSDEYGSYRDIEHIKKMLSKFDIYSDTGIRIQANHDDKSFYITSDINSGDNYFALDDSGLEAFRSMCEDYDGRNISFDREKFIEKFKIAIMEEGWVEDEYSNFVSEIEEKYGNELEIDKDKDYDINVDFPSFDNPLQQFKEKLNSSYFALGFTRHRELSDMEKIKYPYVQYTIDFFKYFLFEYLEVPNIFSITGNANSGKILARLNLIFDNRSDYNFDKIKSSVDLLMSKYNEMISKFEKFSESVLIPSVENSTQLNINDVYIKDDDVSNVLDSIKTRTTYEDLALYSKKNNNVITNITIWASDVTDDNDNFFDKERIDKILNDKIKYYLQKYPQIIFPPYNSELAIDFFNKNFSKQMTFKDFFKEKEE